MERKRFGEGSARQMTDNLRDRIAAAIESIRIQRDGDSAWMADAVIRELGLRREDLGGFRVPGYGHRGHRYVTDWIADE